jgi:hypothetical protein
MESPSDRDFGAVQTEIAKVFRAMRPLERDDLVRGQYAGYRKEQGVAKNSDVETLCAMRLFIDLVALGGSAMAAALRQVPRENRDRGPGASLVVPFKDWVNYRTHAASTASSRVKSAPSPARFTLSPAHLATGELDLIAGCRFPFARTQPV